MVNDAGTVEQIDYSKWDIKDCVVTDLKLPSGNEGKFARTIEHLLTDEECKAMIASTEKLGYEQAMINIGGGKQVLDTSYRKNQRCIVDTFPVTDIIWERLKPFIPEDLYPKTKFLCGWNGLCLNERLRFLRYDAGDFF